MTTGESHDAASIPAIARRIAAVRLPHPVRVAVDGRTASGKSTFADQLAEHVRRLGRSTIRASVDDFHRAAAERHRRGRYSPEGYYEDARDLDAFVDLLLRPLGPGGDLRFAQRSFDLEADRRVEPEMESAAPDAVLIVDGTFLQRRYLRGCFDLAIFLDVPEQVARARAIARDAVLLGGSDEAERLYDFRYAPAFRLYEAEANPRSRADVVVGDVCA